MKKNIYLTILLGLFIIIIQSSCKKQDETTINDGGTEYDEYVISMKGGGGYYTESIIEFDCSVKPIDVYGKGKTDDSDGSVRVGISNSPSNFKSFEGDSYQKISGVNSTFYVLLNSKWGTDKDTYAYLKLKLPKGATINYIEYDDHDDDLDYVHIDKQ